MPPEGHDPGFDRVRLDTVERDQRDLARQVTEISRTLITIDKDTAVKAERDKGLDERLERIEESIRSILGLGKWVLGAVGATVLTAIIGFILKGGLLG